MEKESPFKGVVKSLGLVFGDIGTSPIYTITVVFLLTSPTEANVIGVLSLITWTLAALVTVQYAWLAMSLGKKGEGGAIVLKELLVPLLRSGRQVSFVTVLSFVSISLLIGDGIITPAISILSAVEGSLLIPGLEGTSQGALIAVAAAIAVVLFSFQRKGTERVAGAFGPLMVLWFSALTVSGVSAIIEAPHVLRAVNPFYGLRFLSENGLAGFFVLSEVILCATGGEALYADMGHLGRKPIVKAWYFVSLALLANYFGQGAFLATHPGTKTVLFEMVLHQARPLYVPFLVLSIVATVIASQAMISGMFSIVFQGIQTRIMPMFKVEYTSPDLRAQVYISAVNWFLLLAVVFVMYEFRESSRLAAAYGLAVTGTMTITAVMMGWIFHLRKKPALVAVSALVGLVDLVYLCSNSSKVPHGAYWSLILATVPFFMVMLYTRGQRRLYGAMKFMPLEEFLNKFNKAYPSSSKIDGTALFLIRDVKEIPFYITQTMFFHGILYGDNVLVSIIKRDDPFGVTGFFRDDLAPGLRLFEVQYGYMEVLNVEELLREAGVEEKTIFYGIEDVATESALWKAFAFIKKATPTFVQFYNLPAKKLHGVLTRVEM